MNRLLAFLSALVVSTGVAFAGQHDSSPPYAWVQATENNMAIVRVITTRTCQAISSATLRFSPRTAPPHAKIVKMPSNLCEMVHALQPTPQQITVDGVPVTLPGTQAPERILVLGDTGCREHPAGNQDCDSNWFFKEIADSAAKLDPDLIVHVGDYTYRENCGWANNEGCPGDPDALREWGIWEQDFFAPAQTLLAAAPWTFVRGNHEDCDPSDNRGWVGWTQFFSSQVMNGDDVCNVPQDSLIEHISFIGGNARDLNLFVLNANVAKYTHVDNFAALPLGQENWILTHVPFWSKNTRRHHEPFQNGNWPHSDIVLSGHVHLFALRQMAAQNGRNAPIQVIQGASGVNLESSGSSGGMHFYYANDSDYSVTLIERDKSDDTYMTLCRLSRSQGLKAHASWLISRTGNTGSMITTTPTRSAACQPPT